MASLTVSVFTEAEVMALQEFRRRISDILAENDEFSRRDDMLIRWMRAREMDLDKAEDMIRNSMQWRAENKIDSILSSGIDPVLSQKFPYFLDGLDKFGRPVLCIPFGSWDVRSFIESDGTEKFVRYTNQLLENIVSSLKRETKKIESSNKNASAKKESTCLQFVAISDMGGYSYRQLANMKAVQSLIQMVSVYEAHYPETMGQCFVINAPAIFSILFGMMKPFMSGRTIEKIKVFPEKREQWQPEVLELIDASQVREQYGGTK